VGRKTRPRRLRRPGCRLLIVDDERHITTAMPGYFTQLGYRVDAHGEETIATIRAVSWSLHSLTESSLCD
jgi:hypothetical protein